MKLRVRLVSVWALPWLHREAQLTERLCCAPCSLSLVGCDGLRDPHRTGLILLFAGRNGLRIGERLAGGHGDGLVGGWLVVPCASCTCP